MPGFGFSYGYAGRSVPPAGAAPSPSSPFASINALGWAGDYAEAPASLNPLDSVAVQRTGFDATGAATTYTDTLTATQRVRLPYPDQATLTDATVALSDYVYSTDTVPGATNDSAVASPVPVAQWLTFDRQVVGDTLTVELVAFHRDARNGKPVAAIVGTASDGTDTVTATTSTPIVLGGPNDANAITGYRLTFDLSTLADASAVTVNAKVYPWLGEAASVLDSSANAVDARAFRPLVFLRHTAKAANPPCVYVAASGGTDATVLANGATVGLVQKVSTDPAIAAANPFATLASAASALKAATTITGGLTDGCIIRLQGSVAHNSGWVAGTYQAIGALYIEGDPEDDTAGIHIGTTAANTRHSWIIWRNMRASRADGVQAWGGGSRLQNITLDNASQNTALSSLLYINGMTITNGALKMFQAAAACDVRMLRGVTADAGVKVAAEGFCIVGCNGYLGPSYLTGRPPSGGVFAFNTVYDCDGVTSPFFGFGADDVNGFALVQNVIEWVGSNLSIAAIRPSGDGDAPVVTHLMMWNNVITGFYSAGRGNILYDENASKVRNHTLQSFRGNIHCQVNVKGDVFIQDATHVGNWGMKYGAGSKGEWTMYIDANGSGTGSGSSFAQDYPGLKANYGISATVRNDPMFTDYKGTTNSGGTAVTGIGGGDYTLQSGSAAIGVLTADEEALAFDLAGTARVRGALGLMAKILNARAADLQTQITVNNAQIKAASDAATIITTIDSSIGTAISGDLTDNSYLSAKFQDLQDQIDAISS